MRHVDSSVSSLASTFESDRDRSQWAHGREGSAPGTRGHFRTMNRRLPPPTDPIARGKAWHERLRQYPTSASNTARNSPSNASSARQAVRHPAMPSPVRNVRTLSARQRQICMMPPSQTYYQRPTSASTTASSMLRHRENDIRQQGADASIVWRAQENENRRFAEDNAARRAQVQHPRERYGMEDDIARRAQVLNTSGRFGMEDDVARRAQMEHAFGAMPSAFHRTEDTLNEHELVERSDAQVGPTFLCRMNEELVATALSHLRLGRDLLGPTTCERAVSSVLEQCKLALLELRRRLDVPCNCDPHVSRRTPSSGSGSRRGGASPDSRHGPDVYCRRTEDSRCRDARPDFNARKQQPPRSSSRSYVSRSTAECTHASHGHGHTLSSAGPRQHSQSSRSLHDTFEHSQESPHYATSHSQSNLHRSPRENKNDRERARRRVNSTEDSRRWRRDEEDDRENCRRRYKCTEDNGRRRGDDEDDSEYDGRRYPCTTDNRQRRGNEENDIDHDRGSGRYRSKDDNWGRRRSDEDNDRRYPSTGDNRQRRGDDEDDSEYDDRRYPCTTDNRQRRGNEEEDIDQERGSGRYRSKDDNRQRRRSGEDNDRRYKFTEDNRRRRGDDEDDSEYDDRRYASTEKNRQRRGNEDEDNDHDRGSGRYRGQDDNWQRRRSGEDNDRRYPSKEDSRRRRGNEDDASDCERGSWRCPSKEDNRRRHRDDEDDDRRYASKKEYQRRDDDEVISHKKGDRTYERSIHEGDARRNRPDDGSDWRVRSYPSREDQWDDCDDGPASGRDDRHARQDTSRCSPGDRNILENRRTDEHAYRDQSFAADDADKRKEERTKYARGSEKNARLGTQDRVDSPPYHSRKARQVSSDRSPAKNEHAPAHAAAHALNTKRNHDTSSSPSIIVHTLSQEEEHDAASRNGRQRRVNNEYAPRDRTNVQKQFGKNGYGTQSSGEPSPTMKMKRPFSSDEFQLDTGVKPASGNENDTSTCVRAEDALRVQEDAIKVLEDEDDMSLQSLVRIHEGLEDLEALRRSLKKKVCAPQLGLSELHIHWGDE